jgi:predicted phage terminase large subunit-like protein
MAVAESYFTYPGFWFDQWPTDLTVKTMALDPSMGADFRKGDYQALVYFGRDKHGLCYIEASLRRGDGIDAMLSRTVAGVRSFKPEGLAIETNTFQQLLVAPLLAIAKGEGVELPIYPMVNIVKKPIRIRRLGPDLAQRKLRFKMRSPGTALMVQQLKDFPQGDHEDGADALEMARRLAIDLFNARGQRGPQRLKA